MALIGRKAIKMKDSSDTIKPDKSGRQFTLRKRNKKTQVPRARNTYLTPMTGYEFTPSYIKTMDRYATILKVVNKFGTNRNMAYGWFINVIPEINVDGVKAYLIESDKPMETKVQDDIFKNHISKTIRSYGAQNDTKHDTKGDIRLKELRVEDLENASSAYSANKIAIDVHIYVMITSHNPDSINEQIRKLETLYNDRMNGLQLMAVAGDQERLFTTMLEAPKGSGYDYTWMSSDFAGNDHAVRKGLDDHDGVPVGELTNSFASGTAIMALNRTFSKRILVASPPESMMNRYDPVLSASSLWGQKIANDVMIHNKRVFHVVLNGFKYFADPLDAESRTFGCHPVMEEQMDYIDLSQGGLNPLEMFGDKKDVIEIFNTNQDKIVEMFHLMSGRSLDDMQRITLAKALNDFYIGRGLWPKEVHKNPGRARVLGIKNHETFPVMGDFIIKLTNILTKTKIEGIDADIRDIKTLKGLLERALQSYRGIFNETTTVRDPKDITKAQVYYDLSKLRNNPNIQEAQFLNAFDYIAHATSEGDVIMIHGVDRLSIGTLKVIENRINTLTTRGVRMAYLFDRIGGGSGEKDYNTKTDTQKLATRANIFNTDGVLYQNFDQQFDYTILGTMSIDDLELYQTKVKQQLTEHLKESLTAINLVNQYQIRRQADLTTVQVIGDFLI